MTSDTTGTQADPTIAFADFLRVDMRVGRIVGVEAFPQARKPSFKLEIDFGPLGMRRSSAQVAHYTIESLVGRLVIAVVNFPARQIGPFMSEVLVLGVPDSDDRVTLLKPDADVLLGGRVY